MKQTEDWLDFVGFTRLELTWNH